MYGIGSAPRAQSAQTTNKIKPSATRQAIVPSGKSNVRVTRFTYVTEKKPGTARAADVPLQGLIGQHIPEIRIVRQARQMRRSLPCLTGD